MRGASRLKTLTASRQGGDGDGDRGEQAGHPPAALTAVGAGSCRSPGAAAREEDRGERVDQHDVVEALRHHLDRVEDRGRIKRAP